MEYQTIKENGEVKYVVLPFDLFTELIERLEDESDLRDIREARSEPLYDQSEAENYSLRSHFSTFKRFLNPNHPRFQENLRLVIRIPILAGFHLL